jgi:hypothetical protein
MNGINTPFTAVQITLARRMWLLNLAWILAVLLMLLGLAAVILGVIALIRFGGGSTPAYGDEAAHFMYGSIGAETHSGMPYWMWKTLPSLYPAEFKGRDDYSAFGFLYEKDANGKERDLPIGISRRKVQGIDVVWFNCGTCHVGTWRATPDSAPHIVPGMPSNNLDLHRFIRFVLNLAGDERLSPDKLIPAMQKEGAHFDWLDKLAWRYAVLPRVREGLVEHQARLKPLLDKQPDWGPGRVDTFNPYKLLLELPAGSRVPDAELVGTADFPAIFDQGPREGMKLHWDGDNDSLAERNLSAAVGAGVTPDSVDVPSIERDAAWLKGLKPPPSPHHPDPAAVERGKAIYMQACAACHGWQGPNGYVFEGARIGQVEPNKDLGVDPNRLDSYTQKFRDWQVSTMFADTPYHFTHFAKTDGYANLPLDGLWLRAPYLHDGSVPNLAALLTAPDRRPKAFVRGSDVIDPVNGGFVAPSCTPGESAESFCFDTAERGNSADGHAYGTDLPDGQKKDLLAYLLTF